MGLWYRIFGRRPAVVPPSAVLGHLHALGVSATGTFAPPGEDWAQAVLHVGDAAPLELERFLAAEEGIRAELNTWAAFLETCADSPNSVPLMEHMIQTSQLFTLRHPLDAANEERAEQLCVGLAQFLADATDGVYQVDDEGFYTADGVLILPEG